MNSLHEEQGWFNGFRQFIKKLTFILIDETWKIWMENKRYLTRSICGGQSVDVRML